MTSRRWVIPVLSLVAIVGTGLFVLTTDRSQEAEGGPMITLTRLSDIDDEQLAELSKMTVFFGHQSVGSNIVDGLLPLVENRESLHLPIAEINHLPTSEEVGFFHAKIGRNNDPISKIRDFESSMKSDLLSTVDIAFMKFCYVDVENDNNIDQLFLEYTKAAKDIKRKHPSLILIHWTVPIESLPVTIKDRFKESVKSILGRNGVVEKNRFREQFNQMIRSHFGGVEPVFDLARIEAVGPDGLLVSARADSLEVPMMDRRYTNDGGHLNEIGRKHVAEQLLVTLSAVASERGGD